MMGERMKRILNPWTGIKEYNCFGCSPDNPMGLHMQFFEDGDDVVCRWTPQAQFQGWVNVMHGGILAALIDETCGWVVTRKCQTAGFTTALNLRYKKKVSVTSEITIRARVKRQVRNLVFIDAELSDGEDVCTTGEATYFLMDNDRSRTMGFRTCEVEE